MTDDTKTKTSTRRIGVMFAMVREVRETLTGQRLQVTVSHPYGAEVELDEREEKRLDALGALMTKDGGPANPPGGMIFEHPSIEAASAELTDDEGNTLPKTVAAGVVTASGRPAPFTEPRMAPFTPVGANTDALQDWLRGSQNEEGKAPTVDEIVDAVAEDPTTARMVLQAEDMVNDGQPRAGLVKRLTPIAGRS